MMMLISVLSYVAWTMQILNFKFDFHLTRTRIRIAGFAFLVCSFTVFSSIAWLGRITVSPSGCNAISTWLRTHTIGTILAPAAIHWKKYVSQISVTTQEAKVLRGNTTQGYTDGDIYETSRRLVIHEGL